MRLQAFRVLVAGCGMLLVLGRERGRCGCAVFVSGSGDSPRRNARHWFS